MTIEAVVFDWGGTLSQFVPAELADAWRLVARHIDPAREDELTARLVQVEADFWATTSNNANDNSGNRGGTERRMKNLRRR